MSYKNLPRFDSSVGYKEKRKNEAGASNKKEKTIMIERGNKEGNGAERAYGADRTNRAYGANETYRAYGANETYGANGAYGADKANGQGGQRVPLEPKPFLPKKGNYRGLLVYQKAECLYDISFYFAHHYFVERKDRTIDQVIQAARSGKQNIAEGCAAASTSSETELKLLGVARASMKEVLEDYIDYLRTRHLEQWSLDDPRTKQIQEYSKKHNRPEDYTTDIDKRSPEALCNIAITLIHQYDNLMGKLIDRLQKDFVEEGGIRERMTAARVGYRNEQKTRITELEAENATLKAKIVELEKKLKIGLMGLIGPMGLIGLMGLIGAMGLMGCSSGDAEEQMAKETGTAIAFSARQGDESTVTRSERGLEEVLPEEKSFLVWAFKNPTASTFQYVMDGYTVNWIANSANTTNSNTNDWEYVNQQPHNKEEQTIKYWDWGVAAYRFFGATGTVTGQETTIDTEKYYQVSFLVNTKSGSDMPYFSHLWYSTGKLPEYSARQFGQPVKLEFIKPVSIVRFKFIFEDPSQAKDTELTQKSFKPTNENRITTKAHVTVSYPLTGTGTTETFTATDQLDEMTEFKYDYYETVDYNNDHSKVIDPYLLADATKTNQSYTVVPVTGQGSYTLHVYVNGELKTAVVPAEYMDWKPGYQYTYIFKVHVDLGVTISSVESAFTKWKNYEKTHTVYNW